MPGWFDYRFYLLIYFIFYISVSFYFIENREKPILNWIKPDLDVFRERAQNIAKGKIPILDFSLVDYPVAFGALLAILAPFSYDIVAFSQAFAIITSVLFTATSYLLLKILQLLKIDSKRILFFVFSPTLMMFNWARFDIIPTFSLILAIYLFLRNRNRLAGVFAGVGMLFKVYPAMFVGADFLGKRKFFFIAVITYAIVNLPFLLINYENSISPYTYFLSRGANPDSFFWILQDRLGVNQTNLVFISLAILVVSLLFLKLRGKILETTIALIVILLATSKVFSPQWVIWLTSLLILTKIDLRYILLLDFANVLVFPFSYAAFPAFDLFIILRHFLLYLTLYKLNILNPNIKENLISLKNAIFRTKGFHL